MATDGAVFQNISATTAGFKLIGGQYGITCHAGTWGGGTVTLQMLGADNATWLTAATAFNGGVCSGCAHSPRLKGGSDAADDFSG